MLSKARELPDIRLTQCCVGAEEGLLLCLPVAPYNFLFTRIGFKRPLLKQMMVGGVGRLEVNTDQENYSLHIRASE